MRAHLRRAAVRLRRVWRQRRWVPAAEVAVIAVSFAMAVITWSVISSETLGQRLLTPPLTAALLLGNLVPAIALLVMIGRRVAKGRAARSLVGGDGRLHVRLVAIFSLVASIPTILVVVFASLLFQAGVQFWFSDSAKATLEGAAAVAQGSYEREQTRVAANTETMAFDLSNALRQAAVDDPEFLDFVGKQLVFRELSEALVVRAEPGQDIQTVILVNPRARDIDSYIRPEQLASLRAGARVVPVATPDGVGALAPLPAERHVYLYAARFDPVFGRDIRRSQAVLSEYRDLSARSRDLQLRFNAALFVVSLLVVGTAVWVALGVADRLVQPVGKLVAAARQVAVGDLSARVEGPTTRDEIGTLASAFNQMTDRLKVQKDDLVAANEQSERRRVLIEAVLSGVSAGVLSIGLDGVIRVANRPATDLLAMRDATLTGARLADVAPDLAAFVASGGRDDVVDVTFAEETRTLAVKAVRDASGCVLTFDDITQQIADQRRAAWADVARRVAHEIKNPLTPIQLAAERLKRRYAAQVVDDGGTFIRLTDTIVRQVGDLRRMVDEFSSFARMPKAIFRSESIVDILRQSVFLHEVAHPDIVFALAVPDDHPGLVCDRRQLGQAFTNLIKNAVEAIEARGGGDGRVEVALTIDATRTIVQVADNGIGLPSDRDRIIEPYVTTRARGTGLGLAVVKRIVEEHASQMSFADRPGGGTVVTLIFDTERLGQLAEPESAPAASAA